MRFTLLGLSAFKDPSPPAKEGPTMRFTPAKTAAAAAALVVSAGLFVAAPAQSQTANFENLMKVAAQADTISCPDLKKQLDKTGRVNANTTRTDLVNMANAELASKPALRAAAGGTINKVVDRAVACGLVKTGNGGNNAPAPSNRLPGVPAPARPVGTGTGTSGQPGRPDRQPSQPGHRQPGPNVLCRPGTAHEPDQRIPRAGQREPAGWLQHLSRKSLEIKASLSPPRRRPLHAAKNNL